MKTIIKSITSCIACPHVPDCQANIKLLMPLKMLVSARSLNHPYTNIMKSLTSKFLTIGFASAAMLAAGLTNSRAVLTSYDGFDTSGAYTNGNTIFGLNGGTGWSAGYGSNSATSFNSVNPGLTFGSLQTTTGAAVTPLSFGYVQSQRGFSAISSGSLWISWLYSPGSPSTDYSGLGLTLSATGSLFYIGTDGNGQFRIDTTAIGGTNATYGALTAGTRFIAVNVDYSTGNVNVYSNPTPGGSTGAAIASFSALSPTAVDAIGFLGFGNGVTAFDEIRIGDSYASVSPIPEPSTFLLLGGAGLLLALKRKRRFAA